jgi:hypothetical protein
MEMIQLAGTVLLASGITLGVFDGMPGDNPIKVKDLNIQDKSELASHQDVLSLLFTFDPGE